MKGAPDTPRLEYDVRDSIGYWLAQATTALRNAVRQELAPHGITFRQFEVLAWLALDGDSCQVELARRMEVEAPTMARLLDRMERDGWVQRVPVPGDRRKKRVRPTAKAHRTWGMAVECAYRVRARAQAGMEPAEIEQMIAQLQQIVGNLEDPLPADHASSENATDA